MTFINNKLPDNYSDTFEKLDYEISKNSLTQFTKNTLLHDFFDDTLPEPLVSKQVSIINPLAINAITIDENDFFDELFAAKEIPDSVAYMINSYVGEWVNIKDSFEGFIEEINFEREEEIPFTSSDFNEDNIKNLDETKNAYQLAHIGKKLFISDEFGQMNSILSVNLSDLGKSTKLYFLEGDQFIELTKRQKEIASKVILRLISIRIFKPKFIIHFIQELYRQEKKDLAKEENSQVHDRANRSSEHNTARSVKSFFINTLQKTVVKALGLVSFIISQKAIEELRIREHRKNEKEREERNKEYDHKIEKRKDYDSRVENTKQHERLLNKERSVKRTDLHHSAKKV